MNCEKTRCLFPSAWDDSLTESERSELKSHLAGCADCRQEQQSLVLLWQRLGQVPPVDPGPAVRARFYAMLQGYERGLENARTPLGARHKIREWFRGSNLRWLPVPVGLAVVLAVGGFLGGYALRAQRNGHEEMAGLRQEVREMRRMVTISLLQQQSASERLKGISWSSHVSDADPEFLSTLFRTLNYDQNVDVRLASVDALSRFAGIPDALVQLQARQSIDVLRHLEGDSSQNQAVRQRAGWGVQKLS